MEMNTFELSPLQDECLQQLQEIEEALNNFEEDDWDANGKKM